ncbi:MAG TPA: hypothetical protein VMX38_14460 [Verrucomicrobiae bacterium]|nr:hypothetical protein [Verrucomicrobiae bacterium]
MKLTRYSVAVLFVSMIANVSFARAATCSNASIKGTYGIVSSGLNGSLQPAASVDQIMADGNGNISGTSTKSIDGTIVTYAITGTYSIAANCNGSAVFNNQDNETEHDNIYLNELGAGGVYNGGFLVQTDSEHVQSSIAVAQGAATCTDAGVKHPYSFEAAGLTTSSGQVATGGRLILNGSGSITGTETISLNGTIHSAVTVTGTYTINSDCTGTASITPKGLSTSNFSLVVVNGGKEIMAVETDADTVITGTFQE